MFKKLFKFNKNKVEYTNKIEESKVNNDESAIDEVVESIKEEAIEEVKEDLEKADTIEEINEVQEVIDESDLNEELEEVQEVVSDAKEELEEVEPKNEEAQEEKKASLFDRLKQGLSKAKQGITDKIDTVLKSYTKVDEELLEDLEEVKALEA